MTEHVREEKKRVFLQALKDNLGIIESALRAAGIARGTYDNWRARDAEFDRACDDVMEAQCDYVEGKLLQRINDGDTTAMIFYLKTKGKHRGWTEKQLKKQEAPQKVELLPAQQKDRRKDFKKRVSAKRTDIIRRLKSQGKYTEELSVMVTLTAETYIQLENLQDVMLDDDYQSVTVQISREGNERRQLNPMEGQLTALRRQLADLLTKIGMSTESKERKQDSDSFKDFLEEMKDN